MEKERAKFIKIFAKLPDKIKMEDIAVVIDERPYTWDAAYFEVKNNTDLGEKILKKIKELGIL